MQEEKGSLLSVFLKRHFKVRLFLHCLGLSALGGALFLQGIVLSGIAGNGYFIGIEQNVGILSSELALTVFAIGYLVYLVWHVVVREL